MSFFRFSLIFKMSFFCLVGHVGFMTALGLAQDDYCDENLEPANSNLGYRTRGDRCEGLYVEKKSSITLYVASFTEFVEDYDLTSDEDLLVQWPKLGSSSVRLRAYAPDPELYYRMDTVIPAETTSYRWSKSVLASLGLKKEDIGIIGWTRDSVEGDKMKVYLPLQISQKKPSTESEGYEFLLIPGRQLEEVYFSLAPVKEDGSFGKFINDEDELEYGYYPPNKAFKITIGGLKKPGVYYLEVAAVLKTGSPYVEEIWFYHKGN